MKLLKPAMKPSTAEVRRGHPAVLPGSQWAFGVYRAAFWLNRVEGLGFGGLGLGFDVLTGSVIVDFHGLGRALRIRILSSVFVGHQVLAIPTWLYPCYQCMSHHCLAVHCCVGQYQTII